MSVKTCSKCETERSLDMFYKGQGKQGTHTYCKECHKECMRRRFDRGDFAETGEKALYIAHNPRIPGEYKVGAAQNPRRRLATMENAQNFRLEVQVIWAGLGHLEGEVHRLLAPQRVTGCPGREWFAVSLQFAMAAVDQAIARHRESQAR